MQPVAFAAGRFGFHAPLVEILTDGLIHKTYKATSDNRSIILQQVNTQVFRDIDTVVNNYALIYNHLERSGKLRVPAMLKTTDGKSTWTDRENSCWRAFEFIGNTYTESLPALPEKIFSAAKCYGEFTAALRGLNSQQLKPTISGFHDLSSRYDQLQDAVKQASVERLAASQGLLEKIGQRKNLLDFYDALKDNPAFRLRAMHHDTKLSNILFSQTTGQAVCPIDLDTVMPGYFFSDVGDMIRSMISMHDENAPADTVQVDAQLYKAVITGYEAGIGDIFTPDEKKSIHYSGQIMLLMQGIRFLTDYLNNDMYYQIGYPEQNFHRALNQLTLLEKLEDFILHTIT